MHNFYDSGQLLPHNLQIPRNPEYFSIHIKTPEFFSHELQFNSGNFVVRIQSNS